MLIQNAELYGSNVADVRIDNGRISAIGRLQPEVAERVINARGGTLLPGLHDHHIHLLSYAASLQSVACGPPEVRTESELAATLTASVPQRGGWVRGYGYHESVAGAIDRTWLDRHQPDVPVRIQHRSGRLWILNSAGLALLPELSCRDGRVYDQSELLAAATRSILPPVGAASRELARYGVTGLTDMTPQNDTRTVELMAAMHADNTLLQRVWVAGTLKRTGPGPTKVHLHDSAFPPLDDLRQLVSDSHVLGRSVAVHCVTEAELVFALAAFREAGTGPGDRIEHASVTPPALLEQLVELGLTVVTQPNFITERGDAYLADVPPAEHEWLYRCRSFLEQGIPLAGGTDAPFGNADPWAAMRAAIVRQTNSGRPLGSGEALNPEQALALFLGGPEAPAQPRVIKTGAIADLCLLDGPWREVRRSLSCDHVRATLRDGELIFDRVDQSPG
jgi:predicted amidohydrolase YtcJ